MDDLYNRQKSLGLNIDQSLTVVGAGGIGYWVCKFAALSGIKNFRIFDPDVFQESNFNRIDLSPISFLGKNKAEVAKLMIENVRPLCDVLSYPFKFKSGLFTRTDWIIDCTDVFSSQEENYRIAAENHIKYLKARYDGFQISINNKIGT